VHSSAPYHLFGTGGDSNRPLLLLGSTVARKTVGHGFDTRSKANLAESAGALQVGLVSDGRADKLIIVVPCSSGDLAPGLRPPSVKQCGARAAVLASSPRLAACPDLPIPKSLKLNEWLRGAGRGQR